MSTALWLLVLLPAVVGAILPLVPGGDRIAAPVALATATVTAALAGVVAIGHPAVAVPFLAGSDFALGVDALSAVIVATVAVVSLLVLVFSAGDIKSSQARFHGLMLLFVSGALVTATALTLPTLLVAWEVMGATSYALIGFWWRDQDRVTAGLTAFVTTRTADLGLYLAAPAALAGGAGLALADLPSAQPAWRQVLAAGVLVACLGKAAQLPFSFWLSGAMKGPSPVSALLHSAAMVAMGGYLLLRAQPLLAATSWAGPTAAWVGALTALVLGMVAVAQRDLKQLLAASTAAQLGFVVMAAGVGSVSGGAAHLVAHAATKAALFLAAGGWLTALGTKQFTGLSGVARRWRVLGAVATVAALSLGGEVPLSLWATKGAILAGALETSPWLYAVGFAAAAMSAAYAAKILVVIWRGVPGTRPDGAEAHFDEEGPGSRRVSLLEQLPVGVLASAAAVLGLLTLPPITGGLVSGPSRIISAGPVELVVSAAVALLVLIVVWRRYVPEPRWALDWLGLERGVRAVVVRPTLALAHGLARFDDHVLDRAVTAAATAVRRSATGARALDDRGVDRGIEGLAGHVRRLGHLARRPQTGLLHQYYLQAMVVLAVGVAILFAVR